MVKRLISAKEVSERLGVNLFTCYAWARSGILPHLKLGSKIIRFDAEAIEKFITEKAQGSPGHDGHTK